MQPQTALLRLTAELGNFFAQLIHIGLHQLFVPVKIAADKAAVAAAGGTEGDSDVKAIILTATPLPDDWRLHIRNQTCLRKFFGRAIGPLQKFLLDLLFGAAGGAGIVDQPHRAHAGQLAPGRTDAGMSAQKTIRKIGQCPIGFYGFIRAVYSRFGCLLAVPAQGHGQGVPFQAGQYRILVGGRRLGCNRGQRKKQADQMLGVVAGSQPVQIDFHTSSAGHIWLMHQFSAISRP